MMRNESPQTGEVPAGEMEMLLRGVGLLEDELGPGKGERSKATSIGKFLSRHVDRPVPIEVDGRRGTATLRSRTAGGRQKLYRFEVEWEEPVPRPAAARAHPPVETRTRSNAEYGETEPYKGNSEDWA